MDESDDDARRTLLADRCLLMSVETESEGL